MNGYFLIENRRVASPAPCFDELVKVPEEKGVKEKKKCIIYHKKYTHK